MIDKYIQFDFKSEKYNFGVYKEKDDYHLEIRDNTLYLKNGEKALLPIEFMKETKVNNCYIDCIMSEKTFKNLISNLLSLLEPKDMINVFGKGMDIRNEVEILDRKIKNRKG